MAISVIVYGRNDNHGYNYLKRVALSLNSFAHHLESEDEIVFVDWNSPVGHPAVPVSIADTLTAKAVSLVRVISVPASIHEAVLPQGVSRHILEPHARNAAIRRMQDGSNWILSTNTDIILKPSSHAWRQKLLSSSHAYLACPRFELPEYFWETLPRSSPLETLWRLEEFADAALLNRAIESHDYCLYDAPGDFQFVQRHVAESIGGFDERMLYGWHVDSNFAKRVWLKAESINSVKDDVQIFHCNHTRAPTHFQRVGNQSNSPIHFVDNISLGNIKPNSPNWGLSEFSIEKVPLQDLLDRGRNLTAVACKLSTHRDTAFRSVSRLSSLDRHQGLSVDEIWPFLLDPISHLGQAPRVLCLTARPTLIRLLEGLTAESIIESVSDAYDFLDPCPRYGLIIVDFTPRWPLRMSASTNVVEWSRQDATELEEILRTLRSLVQESLRGSLIDSKTKWIFINAEENLFGDAIRGQFHLIPSQFYGQVNLATLEHVDPPWKSNVADSVAKALTKVAEVSRPFRHRSGRRSPIGRAAERAGSLRSRVRHRVPRKIKLPTYDG